MIKHERLTKEGLHEDLHSRIQFDRTWTDIVADHLTKKFGTVIFLILNAIFFAVWLILNIPFFGFKPFDPFPFGFLTLVVSLEAIFLSIIVLISQNRQSKISEIRQQIDFEINVRAEEESTKTLQMLEDLHNHFGIKNNMDSELERMEQPLDLKQIQKKVEREEKD